MGKNERPSTFLSGPARFEATLHVPGSKRPVSVSLTPVRKWTIFVVPHTHLDVGYTDYQGKVAETQARVLTQAANFIREYPGVQIFHGRFLEP